MSDLGPPLLGVPGDHRPAPGLLGWSPAGAAPEHAGAQAERAMRDLRARRPEARAALAPWIAANPAPTEERGPARVAKETWHAGLEAACAAAWTKAMGRSLSALEAALVQAIHHRDDARPALRAAFQAATQPLPVPLPRPTPPS
jgi:hypothetical protein